MDRNQSEKSKSNILKKKTSPTNTTSSALSSESFSLISNHLTQIKEKFDAERSKLSITTPIPTTTNTLNTKTSDLHNSNKNSKKKRYNDTNDIYESAYTISSVKPKRTKRLRKPFEKCIDSDFRNNNIQLDRSNKYISSKNRTLSKGGERNDPIDSTKKLLTFECAELNGDARHTENSSRKKLLFERYNETNEIDSNKNHLNNSVNNDINDTKPSTLDYTHLKPYPSPSRKVELYDNIETCYNNNDNTSNDEGNPRDSRPSKKTIYSNSYPFTSDPDKLIEIEDEFGRTRFVKQSERHKYIGSFEKTKENYNSSDGDEDYRSSTVCKIGSDKNCDFNKHKNLIRGNFLQTSMFTLDESKAAAIRNGQTDFDNNSNTAGTHYDSSWEKGRTHGTAFYKFSTNNESLRSQQMEQINNLRQQTIEMKSKTGIQKGQAEQEIIQKCQISEEEDPLLSFLDSSSTTTTTIIPDKKKINHNINNNNNNPNEDNENNTPHSVDDYNTIRKSRMEYRNLVDKRRSAINHLRKQQLNKMQKFVKSKDKSDL